MWIKSRMGYFWGVAALIYLNFPLVAFSYPMFPGDQLVCHQDWVIDGTFTFGSQASQPFHQRIGFDLTAMVIRSVTPSNAWEASYRYDHVRIESQVGDASPVLLAIWPSRLVIGNQLAYDGRDNPDEPPPVLCNLLLEDFRAIISPQGEVLRFEEDSRNRGMFPFLDLSQPLYETWMHRPPSPATVGKKWAEDRPFRLFANRITIPASQTYEVKQAPSGPTQMTILALERTIKNTPIRQIPVPMGSMVAPSLRFDALGPDVNALPPDTRILSFTASTQGTVEYQMERGFLSRKETHDWVSVEMEVPQPDGLERVRKTLLFDRKIAIGVTCHPCGNLSEEARMILLGN